MNSYREAGSYQEAVLEPCGFEIINNNLLEFAIRRASAEDYENVLDCLIEVRGADNYSSRELNALKYNPVIAAFHEDGAIAAVISFSKGIFENDTNILSMLAVKKEFSGRGLARALIRTGVGYLASKNTVSIKTHVVTENNIVQNILTDEGLLPSGFLFGAVVSSKGAGAEGLRSDKRTLAVYAGQGSKRDAGILYAPIEIHKITEKVYSSLGVSFDIQRGWPTRSKSMINVYYDDHYCVFYVEALTCGADIYDILSEITDKCKSKPLNTVSLLINLNDPATADGFESALRLGFVFSGFDPLERDRERVIMYYGSGVNIFADEIKTADNGQLLEEVLGVE